MLHLENTFIYRAFKECYVDGRLGLEVPRVAALALKIGSYIDEGRRLGWEEGLDEGKRLGLDEGKRLGLEEGKRLGLRLALLAVLWGKEVVLTEEDRARIWTCQDADLTWRWLLRSGQVSSAAELFQEIDE